MLHEPNGRVGSRLRVPLRVFVLLASESKSLTTCFVFVQQSCRASLQSPDRKLINKDAYIVDVITERTTDQMDDEKYLPSVLLCAMPWNLLVADVAGFPCERPRKAPLLLVVPTPTSDARGVGDGVSIDRPDEKQNMNTHEPEKIRVYMLPSYTFLFNSNL